MNAKGRDRLGPIQRQIEQAVTDPHDGWWFRAVLDGFAYLESEFEYRLDEVYQHFRGNYVRYSGLVFDLVIEHDPDDTGHVWAEFWVRDDLRPEIQDPRAFAVNDVLRVRDPAMRLPDLKRSHTSRTQALEAIEVWSVGLRRLAPDVLRGVWPHDVRGGLLR
jgi:hypothetical protein